jgi:hypothetical protein
MLREAKRQEQAGLYLILASRLVDLTISCFDVTAVRKDQPIFALPKWHWVLRRGYPHASWYGVSFAEQVELKSCSLDPVFLPFCLVAMVA